MLELQEIHNAEKQLARLIPRLASAASSEDLRIAIEERLEEGEQIIAIVETGLEELGASPGRKKNVAAEGLTNDLREHVQQIVMGPALDTVLIGGLQKTEHYCIAAWGTVKSLAEAAGQDELAGAMASAVEVGRAFDEHLTAIAEEEVRPALTGADEDESEQQGEEEEEDERSVEGEEEDEDEDGDDDDVDDDSTASSQRPTKKRRPQTPLDPQPPVGLPEASIEDDAEDKEEEEEIRGRGRNRPGRDN